jgi:hypothetical protein
VENERKVQLEIKMGYPHRYTSEFWYNGYDESVVDDDDAAPAAAAADDDDDDDNDNECGWGIERSSVCMYDVWCRKNWNKAMAYSGSHTGWWYKCLGADLICLI